MTEAREMERIVASARDSVASCATLDAALGVLASRLADRFRITRISVRIYDPQTDELEFVGVWSSEPTYLGAGVRMPARSTTFGEVELRGSAILGRPPVEAGPLLDQLLRDEGTRSWVVMPLARDRLVVGLLSAGSPLDGGFTEDDLALFDALAVAVGDRLLSLVPA
jgi:GAF domain-containing protein